MNNEYIVSKLLFCLCVNWVMCVDVENFIFDVFDNGFIIDVVQYVIYLVSQFFCFCFFEVVMCNCWSIYVNIGGYKWVFWIVWYVVFVDGDVSMVQSGVCFFIGQVFINQINQEQVVISVVGNYFVVVFEEYFYYCFSVFCDLLLVSFEFRFYCFFQSNCFIGDYVY